jgi:hypothetical protein
VVNERGRSGGESSSISGSVTLNLLSENNITDPRPVQNGHCDTISLKFAMRLDASVFMVNSRAAE